MPISHSNLFLYNFLKTLILSSWPILLLAIPSLLALGIARSAGIIFYFLSLFGLLFFILLTKILSSFFVVLIGKALDQIKKVYVVVVTVILLLLLGYCLVNSMFPKDIETNLFQAVILERETVSTIDIEKQFQYWPSHLYVNLIRASEAGLANEVGRNLLALIATVVFAGFILYFVAKKFYYNIWIELQETTFLAGEKTEKIISRPPSTFPKIFRGEFGIILEKEITLFLRNFNNLYSIGFILFLLLIYTLIIFRLGLKKEGLEAKYLPLLLGLNLAVLGYFASILNLRFTFPSISREGRSAWIIWSSPVNLKKIFWGKLIFYLFVFFLSLELLFLFGSNFLIKIMPLYLILSSVVFVMVVTLTAISLGFGTLMPNFRYSDPERLSTTAGGLATTFLSIFYVGISSLFSYLFLNSYILKEMVLIWPLVVFLVISLGLIGFFIIIPTSKIKYIA